MQITLAQQLAETHAAELRRRAEADRLAETARGCRSAADARAPLSVRTAVLVLRRHGRRGAGPVRPARCAPA